MRDIEILNTVVCDEVRKEVSGKFFLIGVYGDAIVVPSLPRQVTVSLWCHIVPKALGLMTIEVMMEGPDDQKATGTIQALIVAQDQPFGMHIGPMILDVPKSGEVQFSLRMLNEDQWQCVHKKMVCAQADFPGALVQSDA
jgi:hypothetical protein